MMLQRFVDLYDNLVDVVEEEGSTVIMDMSAWFLQQVKKVFEMLGEIKVVIKELQKRGAILSDCRFAVNMLSTLWKQAELTPNQHMVEDWSIPTFLQKKYSSDSAYESAVVKTQRNETSSLSTPENHWSSMKWIHRARRIVQDVL